MSKVLSVPFSPDTVWGMSYTALNRDEDVVHCSACYRRNMMMMMMMTMIKERGSSYDSTGVRRHHERLVFKNGECNVTRANIKKRRQRYMADIFTTLVDIKWRWNLLNFVLAFMLSWLIFALTWWLICFSHGDFEHYVPPGTSGASPEWKPCVEEVYASRCFSVSFGHLTVLLCVSSTRE